MSRWTWIALAAALSMGILAVRLSQSADSQPTRATTVKAAHNWPSTVPPVRVLLRSGARDEWEIRIDGPYLATAIDDWRVLAQGPRLEPVGVSAHPQGLRIGAQEFPVRRLRLKVQKSGTLWVAGRRYRGDLDLLLDPEGAIRAVNRVPIDLYLASVLSSELPADFPLAAQQAQVVAARTYVLFQMKTYGQDNTFDVYDSERSQVYLGMEYTDKDGRRLAAETAHSREVVEQTRDVVLLYRERLFCAYFSAVCGGHTANGRSVFGRAAPPLEGVTCSWCGAAPNYRWQRQLPRADVEKQIAAELAQTGRRLGTLEQVYSKDPGGGIVPTLEWVGSEQTHRTSAATGRRLLLPERLPSAFYIVAVEGKWLRVHGRGWGHGVGMCQWGAKQMAAEGSTCEKILAHYYPGSRLATVR